MPFDERLAQRVREILAKECQAEERLMFGGLAFMINGHMCCGVVGEDLVVRVGPKAHEQALSQPHARPMDFTGRPMKGFVYVEPLGCRPPKRLRSWIESGLEFVLSLPPK
jgi:TfoX/Sxy family transcriptional regulator of competence genes